MRISLRVRSRLQSILTAYLPVFTRSRARRVLVLRLRVGVSEPTKTPLHYPFCKVGVEPGFEPGGPVLTVASARLAKHSA
jgi:hypothetical protein